MAESEKRKVNKNSDSIRKDVVVMILVLLIIAGYIFTECYKATHVDVETITAVTSTVYDTIEAKALVIRDEHIVNSNSGAVTVACVDDGAKVKVNGHIAMEFSSEDNARSYSALNTLHNQLDYYIELESKTAGLTTDIETIDRDILNDINSYVRSANSGTVEKLAAYTDDLNDKLTRRQMIIGQSIDFSAVKGDLQGQINAIDANACKPTGYLTAEQSGVFSSYTDGLEASFNYKDVLTLDAATLQAYIEQAENVQKNTQSFGKLITTYEWYFCAVVNTADIKGIKNGSSLDVAIKDSDKVIKCQVTAGAESELGVEQTVLVLQSSQLDADITSMRLEDIEIRYNSYSGFKVPSSAIHIDENGKKCVYALVANQVSQREGEIIYSTKDYSVFAYDPNNSKSIRFYDQIITKGKDLHDGKVYT